MTNQEHKGRAKKTLDLYLTYLTSNRDLTHFLHIADDELNQEKKLKYPWYHLKLEFNLDRGQIYGLERDTRINLAWYRDFRDAESNLVSSVCGYTVESEDTVRVRQLQGRSKVSEFERLPKGWEFILMGAYEIWARENNFRISQIQQAENNKWYQQDQPPQEGRNLRLRRRYDLTAERMGYQLQNGVWTKELDPISKH